MFPSFIGILDIQSWWEVPSIAYFCSLFRTAFNLLDFDIEELEEALLTDGTEDASSLLTELIVRLLNGCLGNNDISAFNYQMYLRRLFRRKCQETGRYNPFDSDIDFQFLPLRTKVEILYALCDFRLDADDVFDLFKNLEAESLRVEPLGWDDNESAYWYFYGTRLYREDIIRKSKTKTKRKKNKEIKRRGWGYGDDWFDDEDTERVWQVICFTEEDWTHLTEKFSKATSKVEKELYRSLSQNFLPEIPRLFQEKERLQRKRLLESAPRRTSSRVLQKIKQKEEESKQSSSNSVDDVVSQPPELARKIRAKRRNLLRSKSESSEQTSVSSEQDEMPQKSSKRSKSHDKKSKHSKNEEVPPEPVLKRGRKTNNSLSAATGQIVIPDSDEPPSTTRKKLKTSQIFSQTEEDVQTDMYKVLEQLLLHDDAWPFLDPVEEEFAPNYYAVIRRPMDLRKMEERLDHGYYTDFSMFKADFKLIVNNCRLYNGHDNEYTIMVDNLQAAFDRLTQKYIHRLSSSDEEIAVEYQLPTPSRKHKLKSRDSPSKHKRKRRKTHSETAEFNESDQTKNDNEFEGSKPNQNKESPRIKGKKKRKGHHRHGKHSKSHKKKSGHSGTRTSKHKKHKEKDGKKNKQKKKKNKHSHEPEAEEIKRSPSHESVESSHRSRSASPLPSIHTLTPSPTEQLEPNDNDHNDQLFDPEFYKDKYDKIKERRRNTSKESWDSLFTNKQKNVDRKKQNINIPQKDKNQKLKETIEKLRAKNEKYKDSSLFNTLFTSKENIEKKSEQYDDDDDSSDSNNENTREDSFDNLKDKPSRKMGKKNTAKNESASEALEQAVKDISKWLDDAPKTTAGRRPSDSPSGDFGDEHDINKDDELSQSDRTLLSRRDMARRRLSSREPKLLKRREIQRTIDRLQPGKSKGNLLTNINANKASEKIEEVSTPGTNNKVRDVNKGDESSPKLSLGSVLPTVEFVFGSDHNFDNNEKCVDSKDTSSNTETKETDIHEVTSNITKKEVASDTPVKKKDAEVETELTLTTKPNQEKATPNLSAWFKAFGTPKSSTNTNVKKKSEETESEEKVNENINVEKPSSPKNTPKSESPNDDNNEGGDSPLPSTIATPRQRRTSTGSSVSERSSFSQDLDSPRHQMSHTSPLLRSPASPRTDDFQKITYPIMNGTVRAGFYQDTTSVKSSPDKSCSPRDAPQSPYSPYSQHVYASNNIIRSTTPNYFVDQNKSPLPNYTQSASQCDTMKITTKQQPQRSTPFNDEYTSLVQSSIPHDHRSFSPKPSPYQQNLSTAYSHVDISSQSADTELIPPINNTQDQADPKASLYPVKKRSYNDQDGNSVCLKSTQQPIMMTQSKNEFQKTQSNKSTRELSAPSSVDNIALALCEKSESNKLQGMCQKSSTDFTNKKSEESCLFSFDNNGINSSVKINTNEGNKSLNLFNKDDVDMVNMGYMNPDNDRRFNNESHGSEFAALREAQRHNISQQKSYDTALNLGVQSMQKSSSKHTITESNQSDNINKNVAHAHHSQYDSLTVQQSVGKFSLNDIEIANKKLYSCNAPPSTAALDYGNWKMSNQMRKDVPSNYSNPYNVPNSISEKLINNSNSPINYNKSSQHAYGSDYNSLRSIQRTPEIQQNLSSELRIPNPRGILRNEHANVSSSITSTDINRNNDVLAKSQKTDNLVGPHSLVGSIPYKSQFTSPSSIPIESLRNLPNIPQMLERFSTDERYLSGFAGNTSSLFHDKSFQMAQMFNKSMSPDVLTDSSSVSIYPQTSLSVGKDKTTISTTSESKVKTKKKKTLENKPSIQNYHSTACGSDVLSSVKTSMIPGSPFNFGATANMALAGGLYGDNGAFTIEDFRNSNQIMAANYMAAAVAHQQRSTAESNAEKMAKPAHQSSSHSSSFPFIGHSQVRAGYPFVGHDPSSPLYQQYLQRHQAEELLRQTGAQIMGLYSPGYPASLGVRQPYDSLNRPSWL